MSLEISATYENGVLKLDNPIPLEEHQRVKVTVHEETSVAERTYGILGWTGDPEILRRIAEDDEFGVSEALVNFAMIAAGESVFVDANVFVYDFGPDPVYGPACNALLHRFETKELRGYTSSLCIHDFKHRAMTVEACATLGWSYSGIGRRLKNSPRAIQSLNRFRTALEAIFLLGVIVLPVSAEDILRATDVSLRHGLLSGDALIVAMMRTNGLVNLASNDSDFDRVPGIVRFDPL